MQTRSPKAKLALLLKAKLVIGTVASIAGCATAPSPAALSASTSLQGRAVTVNTARSIRNNWGGDRLFALIESKGDRWELLRVSASYPQRARQQEVFLVTRSLGQWETTIPPQKHCQDDEVEYSVCTSILSKSGFFGVKRYDFATVKQAVNSIPDQQAQAVMAQFISAESSAADRKYEQNLKSWTACAERYRADANETEQAAGKAMAAAIAGKQLSAMDMNAIRRSQHQQSFESVCGFKPQPPRK
ncbi:MAG: hypothetical protein LBE51_17605 [Acidovorax sp.]|jgi:hypothetical protein|nr:hypothetical protein [Acidovorax sp.]